MGYKLLQTTVMIACLCVMKKVPLKIDTVHAVISLHGIYVVTQVTKEIVGKEGHQVKLGRKVHRGPEDPWVQKAVRVRRVFQETPAKSSTLPSLLAAANPFTAWMPTRLWYSTPSSSTSTTTSACSMGSSTAASRGPTSSTSTSTPGTLRRRTCTSCRTTRSGPSCTPSPATAPSCRVRAWCWSWSSAMRCGSAFTRGRGRTPFTVMM